MGPNAVSIQMAHETPVQSALPRRANICLHKSQGGGVEYDGNIYAMNSLSSSDATSICTGNRRGQVRPAWSNPWLHLQNQSSTTQCPPPQGTLTADRIPHCAIYCTDHNIHVLSGQFVSVFTPLVLVLKKEIRLEYTCRDLAELHSLSSKLPQSHFFFTSPLLTPFLPENISRTLELHHEQDHILPWTRVLTFRAGRRNLACSRAGSQ